RSTEPKNIKVQVRMGEFDRIGRAILDVVLRCVVAGGAAALLLGGSAQAGPPYISDDPEPTDYQRYEIYLFSNGSRSADGASGESGVDFNYGALPDLQLTAVVPIAYAIPRGAANAIGFGNVELAAKYRFLHQKEIGWDIAVFPRVFLP